MSTYVDDSGTVANQIHTLNLVDRELLRTAGHDVPDLGVLRGPDCYTHQSASKLTSKAGEDIASSRLPSKCSRDSAFEGGMTLTNPSWQQDAHDVGETVASEGTLNLSHPVSQIRAMCMPDDEPAHMTFAHLGVTSSSWGNRYFERQSLARCGLHALNNIVGGPQFLPADLQAACVAICSETGETAAEHALPNGWYSHSVLARVIQETIPPRWRLELNPLSMADLHTFLLDPLVLGALMNENNLHWTALVKHVGLVWYVDSNAHPQILDSAALTTLLCKFPSCYALVDVSS